MRVAICTTTKSGRGMFLSFTGFYLVFGHQVRWRQRLRRLIGRDALRQRYVRHLTVRLRQRPLHSADMEVRRSIRLHSKLMEFAQ